GFFVNTLVLRIDLRGEPSFCELLSRTRNTILQAFAHQDMPFEKLVEALQPDRDLGRNPLCQVFFQLADLLSFNGPEETVSIEFAASESAACTTKAPGRFSWVPLPVAGETSKFDLNLSLWLGRDTIGGRLEYSTGIFSGETAERMAAQFQLLVERLAACPQQKISDLSMLSTGSDPAFGLITIRSTPICEISVHELIDEQAAQTPEALAVGHWSYQELTELANGLAHQLRKRGVELGSIVALSYPRSPDLVLAAIAVWKAGAAYVMLDESDPQSRREQILSDARPDLILSAETLLPEPQAQPPLTVGDSNRIAYILYTSGSTGTPKGVLIEHRSLANFLAWFNRTFPKRLPWITRLAFDASLKQVFAPLLRGESIWIPSPEAVMDPAVLATEMAKHRDCALNCVPTQWEGLLGVVEAGLAPSLRGALSTIILGGERLSPNLARRTLAALPEAQLWNVYGPTETTSVATAGRITSPDQITIGSPIPNVDTVVRDCAGQKAPTGVPGELWIGGAGVGRGYLRRPELTRERFVERDGQRMYRTGDRVRQKANGDLEYLGRLDDQIKIAGWRIEPGEIEAQLNDCPGVRAAVVILLEKQLIAYVVGDIGAEALRAQLQTRLPPIMVPSRIEILASLPRTANGKVDKRALPAPTAIHRKSPKPAGAIEQSLALIWQEVLGLDQIGVHDNFFDLGGRSLLLIRVQKLVAERLKRAISILDLFRLPTIHAVAAHWKQEEKWISR
ncbi:MAG: amino acid adenylation domain-containing protein, partial [Verrucomicrobia bacterium]|nr:amino acid adenylation domain-containing protein [Verrucomicrobiota bacterium]